MVKQESYARRILKEAKMQNSNPAHVPMDPETKLSKVEEEPTINATSFQKLVGCLRYLMHTRPDMAYSDGVISQYIQDPRESHGMEIKHVLRYIQATVGFGIKYDKGSSRQLIGYSDSSHNVDVDDRRSTTGHIFYFVIIRNDNQPAIELSKNPVFHGRSKHIVTRDHFIRECVENEQVLVEHVAGDQ
ncbi:hypothetical protein OSB04_028971 [Centaurea solstitialis]|uniref:Uncharacterized protein n=1 Tax=Centaurea solstitialis TaxID=347529 RepID=A0AA38W895_9ASTR|nr:hypothetical protein OSB04_028971 [Centaurea solstitialis]